MVNITETIRAALDNKRIAGGVFVDLQKAFDTVNHEILLHKLNYYGIRGTVHDWFASYLSNRTQYVSLLGFKSNVLNIRHGVPQGSVMGPLAFILYASPLSDVISAHCDVRHMVYADDTQLYIILHKDNIAGSVSSIEDCFKNVKDWACNNNLMLNSNKTEMVQVVSQFRKPGESATRTRHRWHGH